jgi:hypothetical protein
MDTYKPKATPETTVQPDVESSPNPELSDSDLDDIPFVRSVNLTTQIVDLQDSWRLQLTNLGAGCMVSVIFQFAIACLTLTRISCFKNGRCGSHGQDSHLLQRTSCLGHSGKHQTLKQPLLTFDF